MAESGGELGFIQVLNYETGNSVRTMIVCILHNHSSIATSLGPVSLVLGHGGCIIACDPAGVVFLDENDYLTDTKSEFLSSNLHKPASV